MTINSIRTVAGTGALTAATAFALVAGPSAAQAKYTKVDSKNCGQVITTSSNTCTSAFKQKCLRAGGDLGQSEGPAGTVVLECWKDI